MNQKMTPNTRLTTRKVPSDSVRVVTKIWGPAFFIRFQMSSVPIIRPNTHSKKLSSTPNHRESSTDLLSRPRAWGPMIMPAISQPRMAGSFNRAASLPAANAIRIAASSRSTSIRISIKRHLLCNNRRIRLQFESIALLDGFVYILPVNFL